MTRGLRQLAVHRRAILRELLPWLLLVLATTLVLAQVQRPAWLLHVWIPWAETGAQALVMTAVILSGGIDLSVGSMVALCVMLEGLLWQQLGWPLPWAVAAALATGLGCGAVNAGLIITGLSPLVATLATMAVYSGAAMLISAGERVTGFPDAFLAWSHWVHLPIQFWLLAVVLVGMYLWVHHTPLGRQCYAIGDNPRAARFAAVAVPGVQWRLYMASGLVAALVAVFYTVNRDAAVPDAHQGVELRAIACVVVGGTSITGGRGSILRTLLGLGVIANLDIGLEFLGTRVSFLTAESRLVVIGVLLIGVAVWNERR